MPCRLHVLPDVCKEWDSPQRDLYARLMHRQLVALRYQVVHFSDIKFLINVLFLKSPNFMCWDECSIPWLLVCTYDIFEIVNKLTSLTVSHPVAGINFPCPFGDIFGIAVLLLLSENPCDSRQLSSRNPVIGTIKNLLASWWCTVHTWIIIKRAVGLIRRITILKTTWTIQWGPAKHQVGLSVI